MKQFLLLLLGVAAVISVEVPLCQAVDPAAIEAARKKGIEIKEGSDGKTKHYDVCITGKIAEEHISPLKEVTPIHHFGGINVSNIDQVCTQLKFDDLRSVIIIRSPITNNGLKSVLQSPTIHSVLLSGVDITDEECEYFKALPVLAHVTLQQVKMGNKGAKYISECKSINHVTLSRCAIDDDGVALLAKLPKLEYLSLTDCKITNASMSHLGACQSLRHLCLQRVAVDKDGLNEALENLELKFIILRNMRIEADAIEALRVKFPKVEISTFPPTESKVKKTEEAKK